MNADHPGKGFLSVAVDGVRGFRPHPMRIDRGMTTSAIYGLRDFEIEAIAAYVSDLEARLEKALKVIKPFAALSDEPMTITAHGSTRASINTDNFRAARAWMEQNDE